MKSKLGGERRIRTKVSYKDKGGRKEDYQEAGESGDAGG